MSNGARIRFDFDRYQLEVPAGEYLAGMTYLTYLLDPKYLSSTYSPVLVGATTSIHFGSAQIDVISASLSDAVLGQLSVRVFVSGTNPVTLAAAKYTDVIMIHRAISPVAVVQPEDPG